MPPHPSAYTDFVEWATDRGISLYPAQDEAVTELVSGRTSSCDPTGTGKSLVAVAAHASCLDLLPAGRGVAPRDQRTVGFMKCRHRVDTPAKCALPQRFQHRTLGTEISRLAFAFTESGRNRLPAAIALLSSDSATTSACRPSTRRNRAWRPGRDHPWASARHGCPPCRHTERVRLHEPRHQRGHRHVGIPQFIAKSFGERLDERFGRVVNRLIRAGHRRRDRRREQHMSRSRRRHVSQHHGSRRGEHDGFVNAALRVRKLKFLQRSRGLAA